MLCRRRQAEGPPPFRAQPPRATGATMKHLLRKPLIQALLARLLGRYLVFALRTTRWTLHGEEHLAPHAAGAPAVLAFWHEHLPLVPALVLIARRLPFYRPQPMHTGLALKQSPARLPAAARQVCAICCGCWPRAGSSASRLTAREAPAGRRRPASRRSRRCPAFLCCHAPAAHPAASCWRRGIACRCHSHLGGESWCAARR